MRLRPEPPHRRCRPRLRLGACIPLVLAISASACATGGPSAVPGQRVAISEGRSLAGRGPTGAVVVGELVRRQADTVWVRPDTATEAQAFIFSASGRLGPRIPTSLADPWLLGDTLRERRVVGGSHNGWEYWTVESPVGDSLALEHARTESFSSDRPLRAQPMFERQVRRVRAGGRVIGGLALIAAGVLPLVLMDNDPEPTNSLAPVIDGRALVIGAVAGGIMGGGVALMISGFMPRPGWDPVPEGELPPLRRSSGPTVGVGVRIGAGP